MKLNARINSERPARTISKSGDKYLFTAYTVKNEVIGTIELELLDDGEWLLKHKRLEHHDWNILDQGHIYENTHFRNPNKAKT